MTGNFADSVVRFRHGSCLRELTDKIQPTKAAGARANWQSMVFFSGKSMVFAGQEPNEVPGTSKPDPLRPDAQVGLRPIEGPLAHARRDGLCYDRLGWYPLATGEQVDEKCFYIVKF